MEKAKSVRILQVCKISPPSDPSSPPSTFSLPFTYFDALFLKFPPTERLFFYSLSNSPSNPPLLNPIISQLKHSLSLTLHHFLPLSGNLTWSPESPKPTILYTPNDAVSLTVAESDADFSHFCSNEVLQVEECRPFVPELPASDTSVPVMALQITLFPKGLSIGISVHHSFVDGKSSIMFLKSWAHIFNQNTNGESFVLPQELTPSFDRSMIKDPKEIDMLYIDYWLKKTNQLKSLKYFPNLGVSPDMVRRAFELTSADIEKLRKSARNEEHKEHEEGEERKSSFVLAFAYLSICAIKAARIEQKEKKVYLGFYADWRARLEPPVPANYFGNCGGSHGVFAEAGEFMNDSGVRIISKRIHETIRELNKDVTKGAEESLSKWENVEEEIKFVGIVGSPRLGVYGLDFGWGRPENVKMVSIERTGSVSIGESRDGRGIELSLVLPKHEMELFASLFHDGLNAL